MSYTSYTSYILGIETSGKVGGVALGRAERVGPHYGAQASAARPARRWGLTPNSPQAGLREGSDAPSKGGQTPKRSPDPIGATGRGLTPVPDNVEILSEISFEKGLIHGRALVPMIKQLLEKHSLTPSAVAVIAVSAGPGSFTGVRVGVACAKTMAYATGAKLVSIATPDVIVRNAPPDREYAIPVGDARRGNVFARIYRRVKNEWVPQTDFLAITPDELLAQAPRGSFLLGDAIPRYADLFKKAGMILADESLWYGKASEVVRLALPKIEQGTFEDAMTFAPTYLRPTEAEINLLQKRLHEKHG